MAVFLPVLKVALPYITQIVTAAVPMFTSKPAEGKADEVIPRQIRELQSAVTQNAESVKGLALQLKETIEGLDAAAARLQREIVFLRRLAIFAAVVAAAAAGVAIWAVGK
ncbi:hypothetical protein [Pollutimonas bauzanensis]|uniref:Uncharacterized protein n=1 Tax=Pollutimonas bauzanensis TaxID=658167 RepID=A0A1M5V5M1_9BURK|nr:hypothetical protein [Pollutimonas bauzanensis]SHH70243.1 hypothetical protein SAMN04488135_104239 [Pollutimonas bauzanensis]